MTIANTCVFTNKSLQSVGIKDRIRDQVSGSIPAGAITFFLIKSVLTTYISKGGISDLREREREREFANFTRFLSTHFRCIRLLDLGIARK